MHKKPFVYPIATVFLFASGVFGVALARDYPFQETISQTLEITGEKSVVIDNMNGDLKVQGWDQKKILIEGRKMAPAKEDLQEFVIDTYRDHQTIHIKVKYPRRRFWFFFESTKRGRVDLALKIPRNLYVNAKTVNGRVDLATLGSGVKARSVNGAIHVNEIMGAIDLKNVNGGITMEEIRGCPQADTVNGSLQVSLFEVRNCDEIELRTVNGTIDLELNPRGINEVKAQSINGSIGFNLPTQRVDSDSRRSQKAVIGLGSTRIQLQSVNGSIKVSSLAH